MNYTFSIGCCTNCKNEEFIKRKLIFGKCPTCFKLIYSLQMINEDGILLFGSRDLSDKEDHLYSYAAKGYHDIFLVYISELFRGKYPLPRYYIGTWPDNIRQELIPKALELIQTKEHQLIRIAENLR